MTAGIYTVIPRRMDVTAATCIAVIVIMVTIAIGLKVPKYSTSAMVLILVLVLSTLASISKHWCLEYLVQEILFLNSATASGGDCKI
uniref:Uncharacterized protein n=1 Tax=Arundo donax TaxID=35708 RepID=A0A0A9G2E2_ARUDO